jgi:hypothetical protein
MLCWMKISVEFSIEIAMIVSTAFENYNVWMIMDFSALVVVNYIDLYYCQSIDDDLKLKMAKEEYCMPINREPRERKSYSCGDKVFSASIRVVKLFYEVIYFHFFPYVAIAYSYYGVSQLEEE